MGLLDSVLGNLLGGSQDGNQGGSPYGNTSSGLGGVLANVLGGAMQGNGAGSSGGGLGGLLSQFQQAGLGNIAQSWIGNGANQPISPGQLQDVFGHQQVQDMANQAGMDQGDFLSQLSQHLPRAVDGMTPGGQIPADDGSMSV